MSAFIAAFVFLLLITAFATHVFGLPANWLIILILWIWDLLNPEVTIPVQTYLLFLVFSFLGECIEFGLQTVGAKKYGASRSGNWGAIAGAIAGAIFGAPFLLGLGALAGAVIGAYFGCLGIELLNKRPVHEAKQAAWGAMLGKVLGLSVKIGIGATLLVQSFDVLF
jgi:uncharacterized protein YqgC (DUF456 family)